MSQENLTLIVYVIAVIFALIAFVVIFVVAFQKRKDKLLRERYEAELRFEKELTDSRLEIQEQTLKNIAWELHDNIGQLLSVANIQLNMLELKLGSDFKPQIEETKEVVAATVQEVRSLSKTLNSEVVKNNGLAASISTEIERFNRLNFLQAELRVEGDQVPIDSKDEIIIFRILQEFFSNVIKHAKADKLFVHLNYRPEELEVLVEDNGVGFDITRNHGNSGMQNMKSRASILGARFHLTSQPGVGTKLNLIYPTTHEQ